MVRPSKPQLKMTPFFCREKPAARVILTLRGKISPASVRIHVPASSARSAADASAAVIAAASADAADALMGVQIVPIEAATVTVVVIAARIAVEIAAVDASSVA